MSEPWIGDCHLRDAWGQEFTCHAVVWAVDPKHFHISLQASLVPHWLTIVRLDGVSPASRYLSRHPSAAVNLGALARRVHDQHPVELGPLERLERSKPGGGRIEVQQIQGVEPLDMQFGVWDKKTVPDALREPLFGQIAPTEAEIAQYGSVDAVPQMKTYAILDAAKMPHLLTSILEGSGLRYQSLFQDEAQEELAEYAPYLVELEEASDVTRRLFTWSNGAGGLWHKELGVYVRSRERFEDLRKHFRRFTRVQDKNGKWFYWRFWDTRMLSVCAHGEKLPSSHDAIIQSIFAGCELYFIFTDGKCAFVAWCNKMGVAVEPRNSFFICGDSLRYSYVLWRMRDIACEKHTGEHVGDWRGAACFFFNSGFSRHESIELAARYFLSGGRDLHGYLPCEDLWQEAVALKLIQNFLEVSNE